MDKKNINTIWYVLGTIATLFLLYLVAQNVRDVDRIISDAGLAGPLVAIALYSVFALTPIPSEPLTVFCIYFFGSIKGASIIWLGGTIAALVEYYFGLHMRKISKIENSLKKLPFGLNKMSVESPYFLIFGRLIPGYGSKVISIVAGIHRVSLKTYIWTTAILNLVGAIVIGYGGYHVLRLFHR
jgi:uncharacterized membrane protein YdjX (TVP38/TMEM64 family)